MNIGPLDRRVLIEQKVTAREGAYNTETVSWVPLAEVWANVQDVMPSRDESTIAEGARLHTRRVRVRVRWLRELDNTCRVKVLRPVERIMQIVGGPSDIGGNRAFMEIMCEEYSG